MNTHKKKDLPIQSLFMVIFSFFLLLTGCNYPTETENEEQNAQKTAVEATLNALSGESGEREDTNKKEATTTPKPTKTTAETNSIKDYAVCDAYQKLIDVWPTEKTWDKGESRSAQTIYADIENAAQDLEEAGSAADNTELGRLAERVGVKAYDFIQLDEGTREIGFIPYFEESLIGGEALNNLCSEIGREIELHK